MRRAMVSVALFVLTLGGGLSAQWLNYPDPKTPKTKDGKPNLSAPTPTALDRRPDLSGVWAAVGDRINNDPASIPIPRNRHGNNIGIDLPGALAPMTPWARAVREERQRSQSRLLPTSKCLPSGIPPDMLRPTIPFKIVQAPTVTVILLEGFNNWRQIATDGRSLPENSKPAWFGYSVGRWEKDTFVVTTTGFNDKTWLDSGGTPHSEQLRMTEKFRRRDFGHLEIEYTFEDPKAFTNPFSATVQFLLRPNTDLMDYQCENEKFSSAQEKR